MKLKVCGLNNDENIRQIVESKPDFMGFIFYEKSPRYIGKLTQVDVIKNIPKEIKKVGVFVNAPFAVIQKQVKKYGLDYVQLHGGESPGFCKSVKELGAGVIKSFGIDEQFDFSQVNLFSQVSDYFLFDTKTEHHGGSGEQFDWRLLKNKEFGRPVILSGGITLADVRKIKREFPKVYGIDINSRFETQTGIKDIALIKKVKQLINEN
ncbi:MAG: phosphoribosylanthranilate isomerase [Bacteroidota bacterium]|nr:phosphoribosylanthranilate isomerase [Bacteroidota bacterium]